MVTTAQVSPKTPVIEESRALPPQRWLSVAGAATYTSLSKKAILKAIRQGEIPRRKIGRRFFLDARALDEWLEGEKVRQ